MSCIGEIYIRNYHRINDFSWKNDKQTKKVLQKALNDENIDIIDTDEEVEIADETTPKSVICASDSDYDYSYDDNDDEH